MHPPADPDTAQIVEHIRFIREGETKGRQWKLCEVTTKFENMAGIEGHAVYGLFDEAMAWWPIARLRTGGGGHARRTGEDAMRDARLAARRTAILEVVAAFHAVERGRQ